MFVAYCWFGRDWLGQYVTYTLFSRIFLFFLLLFAVVVRKMQGYSTSTLALACFLVALCSQSWIVYNHTTDSSGKILYETYVAPYYVCMSAFDSDQMKAYDPFDCRAPFNGGRLKLFRTGDGQPKFTLSFPYGADDVLTSSDTSKLQTVFACLIIATLACSVANGEHYEYVQRRLRGYQTTLAVMVPAAMPLVRDARSTPRHSYGDTSSLLPAPKTRPVPWPPPSHRSSPTTAPWRCRVVSFSRLLSRTLSLVKLFLSLSCVLCQHLRVRVFASSWPLVFSCRPFGFLFCSHVWRAGYVCVA